MRAIQQGDQLFITRDTELAAILTALDFDFFDPEYPVQIRYEKGKVQAIWMFKSENVNNLKAVDIVKDWKNPEKAIEERPTDVSTYTICAIKNLRAYNKSIKKSTPLHGFKLGEHAMWVHPDDKKYKKLLNDPRAKQI
mgnify:CR=1 FL=1